MFDFSKMKQRETRDCPECGQEFDTIGDRVLCLECQYNQDHPEMAPKYWTWTKNGSNWKIAATWPEREPEPEPGDRVTVHRKNGTESTETIREIHELRYDMTGKARLTCWVEGK